MKDLALFSKEQFTDFFLPTTDFSNGALITSYTFGRDNFNTDVYVNLRFDRSSGATGVIKPILYRGYLSGSTIIYDRFEYEIVTTSGQDLTITLPYKSLTNQDYINYRVEFECVGAISSLTVSEIGLIFQEAAENKGIIGTSNRSISFSSSRRQDINQNFTTFQNYTKTVNYNALTNRNNLDRIVNILENPYQLRDIKTRCNKEVDTYGFYFNGETGIYAYTNPTINTRNVSVYYELIYKESPSIQTIFIGARGAALHPQYFNIKIGVDGRLTFSFVNSGNVTQVVSFDATTYSETMKIFYNVYYTDQFYMDLYVNGVLIDTASTTNFNDVNFTLVDGDDSLYINSFGLRDSGGGIEKLYSTLGNFTVWDSAKTDTEIEALFNAFSSDDSVFYESFNKITLGTINGTEQYEEIGTEEITVVDIDNSTRLLSLTNLSVNYIGSNTQYIDLGLQNLEEI